MIKTSLAFLAGVLGMGVIIYTAGAHFAAPMFFAGIAVVIVPAIAVLSSVSRIRSIARFMIAFADSWEGSSPRAETRQSRPHVVSGKDKNPWGWVKPSTKQRDRDFANDIEFMKEEAAS